MSKESVKRKLEAMTREQREARFQEILKKDEVGVLRAEILGIDAAQRSTDPDILEEWIQLKQECFRGPR